MDLLRRAIDYCQGRMHKLDWRTSRKTTRAFNGDRSRNEEAEDIVISERKRAQNPGIEYGDREEPYSNILTDFRSTEQFVDSTLGVPSYD